MFLLSILLVLGILLSILLSWFRNSNRDEDQGDDWMLPSPRENQPNSKAKKKKGNQFTKRKQILPDPPEPSDSSESSEPPEPTLREFFSSDFSKEEISSVLEECGKDEDEAFKRLNARLDSQDQYQVVKPKRGRRRNQLEAQGSNASDSNTDSVTIDGKSTVEAAPAQESLNVDAENTIENPLVAPSVTYQELEAQGSNASSSNNDEVTIDAGSNVEPALGQESLNENTRENPLVAPSVTSSPSLSNAMIAMNERPSYNRNNSGDTSPRSPLSEVFRESQEFQVSECNVASENSGSDIAESNSSFTGEGDTCKVKGASQSNDGSVEDMASHNLPVEENGHHEVGSGSPKTDIQRTALSLDPFTSGEEDKEVSSLSEDTSTAVLPEHVQAQDAEFSHLSSGAIHSDVNTAQRSSGNNSTFAPVPATEIPTFREYQDRSQELRALPPLKPNRRSSLTGHNAASSSLQQSYPGHPHFPNTSSFNFRPYGNISAQTNSPRSMLQNFSNAPNQSGTGYFDVQRAQENHLAMPQQVFIALVIWFLLFRSAGNNSTLAPAPAMEILPFREYHPIYRDQRQDLEARAMSFLPESSNRADHVTPQQPNRSSSLTGHNSASSSLQQSYLGDPHFPNTSSFNFRPYGNISALTNSPWSMLDNSSNVPNQSRTDYFDIQRALANHLAMPQQRPSSSRTLPTTPGSTHFHGPARNRSRPPSIQGNRFHYSNQQHVPGIQRPNQLQLGTQISGQPFLRVQSHLSGSRHQDHLLNHSPQPSSTALLPANPDNFPPISSNQSLQEYRRGRFGIISPLRNSPRQSQQPSQSDAAFRPRDAGSSTALDRRYELFPRLSQPMQSGSISPFTSFFSDDFPPSSSNQNAQGQDEQLSEGGDAFPPHQSMLPPDLPESSSDRAQGSSEDQEQP